LIEWQHQPKEEITVTIYHYLGYYIGSLIVLLRNGDFASATLRDRPPLPDDPATFLEELQQAGVSYR